MRRQWHQLNHMQIICTTLQTDNHASTHHSIFYGPDALPDVQPTVSKHWKKQRRKTDGNQLTRVDLKKQLLKVEVLVITNREFTKPQLLQKMDDLEHATCTHTRHTHKHPFYGPLDFVRDYPGEPVPEPMWIVLKQETMSGTGISWAYANLLLAQDR